MKIKIMKACGICSDGSSCRHSPSVRVKKPGSHVKHLRWMHILLLVILLAGQASCDETSAALSPLSIPTNAQTSVYYFVVVTVDGQKNESEITAWLSQVFHNKLQSCVPPNHEETTATPTSLQTTSANTSYDTTLMTTATTLQSYNTTMATTTLQSNNTSTAATTTTLLSNNTTTAATTTTLLSNNTTTAATTTLLSNNTTTAATTTTLLSNTTTAATTTTLLSNNTTPAATTTMLLSNNTTTAATTTMLLSKNTTTLATTTALNSSTTTTLPGGERKNKPTRKPKPSQPNKDRIALEIRDRVTQTSENKTTGLFQGIDVSCANETAKKNTKCLVMLQLKQRVPTCCILRTLCAANKTSSDIHLVGKTANRIGLLQNQCNSNIQEQKSCTYTGQAGASCEESATANVVPQRNSTHCGAGKWNNTCSCSAYCNGTDAYYTFQISLQDSRMNLSYVLSLISKITQRSNCPSSADVSCPLSIITSEYKDAKVECGKTASNLLSCRVILGFGHEVPICNVSAAVMNVFRSEKEIRYNGQVTRAAICGNSKVSDNPLKSKFMWININLKPATFCTTIEEAYILSCQNGTNVLVQLDQRCVQVPFTAPSPNVTTAQPNTTTTSPNVTTVQPNTTTISPNVTTVQPNTTTTSPNVTTVQPNTTTISPNVTTVQPNTTATSPNVTTVQPNTTATSPNVTTVQPNTTTTSPNVTTVQPNTTTISPNVTTVQPNTTTTSPNVTTVQPNTTTTSPNVTTAQPNTTTSSVHVTSSPLSTTAQTLNATATADNVTLSAESQANALLERTGDVSNLNSSQVDQLVSQLENLLSGPTVSLALGNTSVHIVSNLLGASPEVLSDSSNRIIGIVDTVGLKLVLGGEPETLLSPAVALSVKPADGSNFQETFFSISDPNHVQVRGDSRLRRSVRTDIPQGSIRLPPTLTQDLTNEQQQLASRVQFNFYQESTVYQDRSLGTERKLNSGILGASVANLSITELQDDVVIHLRNTEPVPANFVATCVFWDFTLNDESGGWNPKGCFVRSSTDNVTVCGCNHLTSFAILLDLSREPLVSRVQATILTFITYIGCGISAIFLSITLLTYLAFGKLRKDIPSKILIQLCLALLLLNLVFMVDAWLALYPDAVGLCISTALFLHYFLLVTFTWMGLEAVHMYLALVKVFNSHISRYMLKFSLVGWGVPMIVVIIVIAIDKDNYGLVSYGKFPDGTSDDFCWLKNDIAFYVAVVAYFCFIFVFNLAMFVVVLIQLCRIKRQNPHNAQHRTTLQDVRSVAGIMILLGFTWGFAFFAWGPVNLPFMYLFAIFNSLQGFFIFVFFCAVKENVRKQWRTYLCCGRMRLAENSEWSRTATQKTVKASVTGLTSLHSSKSSKSNNSSSSSSFLVSDSSEQISGIGSPFEDRAITADEDPSTDVVLNEINRQYRHLPVP